MRRHSIELIGRWIGLHREHRVMQRLINAFAEQDIVDIAVALKQLDSRDLLDGPVHLLGVSARQAVDAKHPDIEPPLRLPLFENCPGHRRCSPARRPTSGPLDSYRAPRPGAGLKLLRRDLRKSGCHRASRRDVAADHSRGLSLSVAQDGPFDEPRRIRRVLWNP